MNLRMVLLCALLALFGSSCLAEEPPKDQVRGYTTWDENYFYLAFKVDCPDVRSEHSAPNAEVTGDDAVAVFVETNNKHASQIGPSCFSMTVTAAGGAQFSRGTDKGTLDPVALRTFKYGAAVQGTVNNPDDIDMGYNVEMAIPWEAAGMKPPTMGDMISFNILVRRHGEAGGGFVSLSSRVKTEQGALDPSKWGNLVFASFSFGTATTSLDKIVSAKYVVRAPLINGTINEKEWHANTSFAIDLPVPPGFVYEARFPVQKMTLAHYYYWYQADGRRNAFVPGAANPGCAAALTDFPAANPGPWFSSDRVQWHKNELSDMAAAGIDTVLACYRGDKASRAEFADRGLDCMVTALDELRAEGKQYPLVAMDFDTQAMQVAYGGKPDLREEEVKRAFYGVIRDFFDRVPPEFRAMAQAGKPRAGRPGNIVFLSTADAPAGFDSSFIDYCGEAFERDLGCPLVWIAGDGFKATAQGFDGVSHPGSLGPEYDAGGRIHIGSVGPGFDNSGLAAGKPTIRSRMGGATYESDWESILAKKPHWVVCDGWNNFHEGSDICASREYGRKYIDATRSKITSFLEPKDVDAQYLRCSVPRIIPPKQFAQAELTIRNIGNSPWRASEGYSLAYRWYRGGRYYGESKVRRPLGRDVLPGETMNVTIGIASVNAQNAPIPDGDCELRFELMRLSDNKWASALGDQPFLVPITIGKVPEWDASYLEATVPAMLASGPSYRASVRVRNDGSATWPKGVTKLGCRLFKVSHYTHDNAQEMAEEVPIKDVRALLAKDCKPGEIAELYLDLALVQPNKKPLEPWRRDAGWSYQLRFDIYNGEKWLSELGLRTANRIVEVFETDYGPRIVDSNVPVVLAAGQSFEAKVVLKNNGAQTWDRKRTQLGYHWYHLDGSEMQFENPMTPIKQDIQPGLPLMTTATVKAPAYDGQYVLVWDLMIGGKWLSTDEIARGGDILPVFVEVAGGRLAFVDLAKLCDTCAASPDTERTLGDFDGRGSSFPAEFLPPDAGTTADVRRVYPSGYSLDLRPQPEGRISFLYPEKNPGAKNAVTCRGQKLVVERASYAALHILGACVGGDSAGELGLNYENASAPASIHMSDWSSGPKHGEEIGYLIRHRHSHGGDEVGTPCYLYHYTIPLDPSRTLTSITFPQSPAMKIVAVTLERAALPPGTTIAGM